MPISKKDFRCNYDKKNKIIEYFHKKALCIKNQVLYLQPLRAISSAGSEHSDSIGSSRGHRENCLS